MAGEIALHFRLMADLPFELQIQIVYERETGKTFNAADWVYMIHLDSEKIRLPEVRRELPPEKSWCPSILDFIGYVGMALTPEEIPEAVEVLKVFVGIPIMVEMYPADKVDDALGEQPIVPPEIEHIIINETVDNQPVVSTEIIEEIQKAKPEHTYVTPQNVVMVRDAKGRFAKKVMQSKERPQDTTVQVPMMGSVRLTPSGQIRFPDGRIGPKLVEGKVKVRRDGSLWAKVQPRGKAAKWIKVRS